MNYLFSLFRCHHWVKNSLIFVPLILAKNEINLENLALFFLIVLCFCLIASANYILNDIIDFKTDKLHPLKKDRAIASEKISTLFGFLISLSLIAISLFISFTFNLQCHYYLMIYLGFAQIYSIWLKNFVMVDIICVTLFYVYRILIGMLQIKSGFSLWLLSFSFFFFLSLATAKRIVELQLSNSSHFKHYTKIDIPFLISLGISSIIGSLLIFLLYINSEKIISQYTSPIFFYPIVVLFASWLLQFWFSIAKGKVTTDLINFVLKSKQTYFYISSIVICLILA